MPAAETNESDQASSRAPPWWIVGAVLLAGALLIVGATLGAYLRLKPTTAEQSPQRGEESTQSATAGSPERSAAAGGSEWQSMLQADVCPEPCSGGIACEAKRRRCTSGFTCVPGTGRERLGGSEKWTLRLWSVLAKGPKKTALDPCKTGRDFWVCLSGTTECASQREACERRKLKARSAKGLRLTAAHFGRTGVRLDVREGGAEGRIVGRTRRIAGLQRGGLCGGFKVGVEEEELLLVTYYLLPE